MDLLGPLLLLAAIVAGALYAGAWQESSRPPRDVGTPWTDALEDLMRGPR